MSRLLSLAAVVAALLPAVTSAQSFTSVPVRVDVPVAAQPVQPGRAAQTQPQTLQIAVSLYRVNLTGLAAAGYRIVAVRDSATEASSVLVSLRAVPARRTGGVRVDAVVRDSLATLAAQPTISLAHLAATLAMLSVQGTPLATCDQAPLITTLSGTRASIAMGESWNEPGADTVTAHTTTTLAITPTVSTDGSIGIVQSFARTFQPALPYGRSGQVRPITYDARVQVSVRPGESTVLGGVKESQPGVRTFVPALAAMPAIGRLFQRQIAPPVTWGLWVTTRVTPTE